MHSLGRLIQRIFQKLQSKIQTPHSLDLLCHRVRLCTNKSGCDVVLYLDNGQYLMLQTERIESGHVCELHFIDPDGYEPIILHRSAVRPALCHDN